jgi:hypothetical protein
VSLLHTSKKMHPECTNCHCIIYHSLAVRKITNALETVLDAHVETVNLIKSGPLNSRIFSALRNEMGSSYTTLLLHIEV